MVLLRPKISITLNLSPLSSVSFQWFQFHNSLNNIGELPTMSFPIVLKSSKFKKKTV